MATKSMEARLTIKAIDRFTPMLRDMRSVTGRFADGVRSEMARLQGLRGPLKLIEDFRKQQEVVRKSGAALEVAREKQRRLLAEIKATRHPTAQMRREFDRARASADRLEQQHQNNRRALRGLQGQLRRAGVNTGDLAGEQRRLAEALESSTSAFGRQMERMRRLESMQKRIVEARSRMDRSLATAANISFVGHASDQTGRRILRAMSGPVQSAVDFETAMSDVRKVVDFDTPKSFAQMSDDILELSTRIPIAADGLAQIVASGGQSGIGQDELIQFAERAAKIGVAFDISAQQSGDSMANIKTALGLTLDETSLLFDAMNHLSNNMASTAPKVLDFTTRVAVDGEVKGFSPTETMAFGSAMIAAGAGADVAATSFRNMGKALVRGEGATDRQAAAFESLGLEAGAVARAMQEDAVGTTIDVMRRINDLPKHLQASVTTDLFGDEARALAPLINNLDLLRDALGLVSEERKYQGSAEREYAARAETTANNLQLMRNQMTRLGISIGEVVLPHLNDLLEMSQNVIDRIVVWTKEHPKLTKWLVIGASALGAMAVAGGALLTAAAGLIGTMAVLRFGLVGLGARAAFAAGDLLGVSGAFRGLMRLPKFALSKLLLPVKWTVGLVSKVPWLALAGGGTRFALSALLRPLAWTARLIPGIGWALLAGELAWHLLLKKLPWQEWIDRIDWSYWFSFRWVEHLPTWNWSEIIPTVNLSKFVFGGPAPSGLSSDPDERAAAVRRGQSLGYGQEVTPVTGARARGGPVMAGLPYLVNEATPRSEIFVPSRSGGILNVPQAQAAFRSHLFAAASRPVGRNPELARLHRGAQGLRAASLAVLTSSALAAPVAAQPAQAVAVKQGAGGVTVNIGTVNIPVPQGVTDPQAIAELAADFLGQRVAATMSASFSD